MRRGLLNETVPNEVLEVARVAQVLLTLFPVGTGEAPFVGVDLHLAEDTSLNFILGERGQTQLVVVGACCTGYRRLVGCRITGWRLVCFILVPLDSGPFLGDRRFKTLDSDQFLR